MLHLEERRVSAGAGGERRARVELQPGAHVLRHGAEALLERRVELPLRRGQPQWRRQLRERVERVGRTHGERRAVVVAEELEHLARAKHRAQGEGLRAWAWAWGSAVE